MADQERERWERMAQEQQRVTAAEAAGMQDVHVIAHLPTLTKAGAA